jgi:hypothetical protein
MFGMAVALSLRVGQQRAQEGKAMKTVFGIALVGIPVAFTLTGNGAASLVTAAATVGGLCWVVSGWFHE